ncbi:hypothetical protein HanHA300_Chr17g0646361 [Helianthus annuus]|nr:hypothetical protein HanHA300_Chr17g0646361 [Helianthus annuus]KAJ0446799.1 hypothetical protein HanHA89_Chr17g0698261 [Helianthus annuus]KAJ0631693.1 hypothetical protein HanLR1_Chr17g0656811 [Helianthus annuus]
MPVSMWCNVSMVDVAANAQQGRDSKKQGDLNKMDGSRLEVAGRKVEVAGSRVEVAKTVVEPVNKTTKTVDNKVDCAQQPHAGTLLSDIANLFPNVMDKNDDLQSEPNENREMPICKFISSDASNKGIETGKKRKDKKAGIQPKQKNVEVIPTVKKPKEVAHGTTIEDSDDDFDNPPWKKTRSGASPQVVEKPQRPPDARSSKDSKTRKRATTVKNCIPLSDGKLTLRLALKHMGELMESLNEIQRGAVRNIGFGSILKFRMGPIPSTLGWWLVNNYDTKTRVLNCGSHHIQITEELVHDVFGVPRGNEEIKEVERARADFHEVVAEWKGQFGKAPARLTPVQFKTYMQGQKASGRIFVLNFLLFYNTLLGETTTNSSINMKFLPALHRGKDIRSFNWCEYMIRCLDRTVETWTRTPKEPFLGPMPLLVAALIRDQKKYEEGEPRATHLIEDINDDYIEGVSIKLDSVRFDQMLVDAYDLQPEQSYPFAKKSDEEVQAKEVKADKKDETKNVKHISKCDPVKNKKSVVKLTGKTHGKPMVSELPKKVKLKKNGRKPIRLGRRKQMLKVARKLRLLSKKFPLMRVSMQSLKNA